MQSWQANQTNFEVKLQHKISSLSNPTSPLSLLTGSLGSYLHGAVLLLHKIHLNETKRRCSPRRRRHIISCESICVASNIQLGLDPHHAETNEFSSKLTI